MRISATAIFLSILVFLTQSAMGQKNVDRIWTGKNGATFRGTYIESFDNGGKIRFFTSSGKMLVIGFGNLIESDQKIILGMEGNNKPSNPKKRTKVTFNPDDFKPLPKADRGLIPERDPKDFGGTNDEAIVDALWVSLLWWNAFNVMPVPKKGDFDRKAEWLHEELTRYIAKGGNGSATLDETKEGLEKYFSRRLEDIGTCQIAVVSKESLTPATLSKMAAENNIVIVKLHMKYSNGSSYSSCAALEKISLDGTFSMHLSGNRFTGKLKEVKGIESRRFHYENGKPVQGKVYELELNDRASLPKHQFENEAKFFINDTRWTGALIMKPFVYKTEGEPVPIPEPEK
ncbi:MAG: hypothetical protein AB8D78_03935 [Akkermansiaceae bacterium]